MERLTQKKLKALLHYSPSTGMFTWKVSRRGSRKIGGVAGHLHGATGYIMIGVEGKVYTASWLANLYMTGEFPKDQIDHINHNRVDDRWSNLRGVTHLENHHNLSMRKDNTSGVTGVRVRYSKTKGTRYSAQIGKDNTHLGSFGTLEEATQARKEALKKAMYHNNHGKKERL